MFIERQPKGENAILVHINFSSSQFSADLNEFTELVRTAGATIVAIVQGQRDKPVANYFIGTGKLAEIQQQVRAAHADLVIVNHDLTPAQERNLEQALRCRVIDRTRLILDIFSQRARTFEGKLQVELAQLQHMATRLVRGWTHLERQKGGIGLRGPGEKQLETDRRLLRGRIKSINQRLVKVRKKRGLSRRSRKRSAIPTVALVGYTNTGKSTLFNRLVSADSYAADKLFATLDPTLRRLMLPRLGATILADTVGFISHLPHDLVSAFSATLEETQEADLLIHVIDASHVDRHTHVDEVNKVLTQIEANHIPQIQVYNKIDTLEAMPARLERDSEDKPRRVWLSAQTGEGVEQFKQALIELLAADIVSCEQYIAPEQAKLRSTLYELDAVKAERSDDLHGGWWLSVCLARNHFERLFGEEAAWMTEVA